MLIFLFYWSLHMFSYPLKVGENAFKVDFSMPGTNTHFWKMPDSQRSPL